VHGAGIERRQVDGWYLDTVEVAGVKGCAKVGGIGKGV